MHPNYSHKLLLVCAMLLITTRYASAQPATMSLSDCIDYAHSNHPDIKVAQLQAKDAEWQLKENIATGLPQFSAGVGYQYFLQRPGIPASALGFPGDEKLAFSAYHSLTPSISYNQLFFSNSYRIAVKASEYYRDYVNQQLAVTRQTLRNSVTDAYLPALLITENLGILDKNIANLEKLLGETKAINQAGFAELLDVDRVELSLSTLRSERDNLVRQREIVVNALKLVMGMPVKQEIDLSDDLQKLLDTYADADLTTEPNFMNRAEYVQLLKGRELSTLQIELNSKTWMPSISGFIQYQPGWQGGFGKKTDTNFHKWFFIPSAVAGVTINIPIWDGGVAKARREQALISVQTLDLQKQTLENAITLEVENARRQFLSARERVANQQKNLDLAQRIYDTTQKKYKAGVGSSFEISQAEQQLYSAQQLLMQARFDLLAAKTVVRKALGGN